MLKVTTSPPAPALRNFLDEVVVPLLVERFLREHQGMGATSSTECSRSTNGIAMTREGVSQNVPLRDETHPSLFSVIAGSSRV